MNIGSTVVTSAPWLLLLAVILPWMWWVSRRSLGGLDRGRRVASFLIRGSVVLLIVAALAELQWVQRTDRVTVVYLLDRSLSVSPEAQQLSVEYVNRSIREQRNAGRGDKAGVIGFGADAAIELPPLAANLEVPQRLETQINPGYTDLAGALQLARAALPPDTTARVVILSDGNENRGDALKQAQALAAAGIGIDVVPLANRVADDVAVVKLATPAATRAGAPFDIRLVLRNEGGRVHGPTSGKIRVVRRHGDQQQVLTEQPIEIDHGTHLFSFRDELNSPDFYTYEAQFIPDDPSRDGVAQNNRATGFTSLAGPTRILVIEDWSQPGEYDHMIERLRANDLQVDVQPSNQLFATLADLQRYDAVIMAGVPRISGNEAADLSDFSDRQVEMLVQNTQQLGAGLIMLGGPNALGAGGWTDTKLEAAMPVDFQIKNLKVQPQGALMIVIDRSGSMSGQKLELSKAAAREAVKVLGARDFVGVVAFDTDPIWAVPIQRRGDAGAVIARIGRISEGGGTDMFPAMVEGFNALLKVEAAVKHMIVLTDGQTPPNNFARLTADMRKANITVSSVAVGTDAAANLLRQISTLGGGKYYEVRDPRVIPRIFVKEAGRVSRPLIFEEPAGFQPQIARSHEALTGISGPLPPLSGVVLTSPKENPLVEIPWQAPVPQGASSPLLATWNYGLGRTAVFAADAGKRWATRWTDWAHYDQLFVQLVRWASRPSTGQGDFQVTAEEQDGKIRVVLAGLGEEGFLDFLPVSGVLTDPAMSGHALPFNQVAPGRYVAELPVSQPGVHFITILPGVGFAPIRLGIDIPYSAEFRARETNRRFLAELAALQPKGGKSGRVIGGEAESLALADMLATNVYRDDLSPVESREAIWPLLVFLAGCLFLLDVFFRRVRLGRLPARWAAALAERRMQEPADERNERLIQLRRRKAELADDLAKKNAGWTGPAATGDTSYPQHSARTSAVSAPTIAPESEQPPAEEAAGHTSRLLEAKRRLWQERKQ